MSVFQYAATVDYVVSGNFFYRISLYRKSAFSRSTIYGLQLYIYKSLLELPGGHHEEVGSYRPPNIFFSQHKIYYENLKKKYSTFKLMI